MKKIFIGLSAILMFMVNAAEITGTVKKVIDGDTITVIQEDKEEVKTNNKNTKIILQGTYKVRFADIDAPESKQKFGKEAKEYLSSLLKDKKILIKFHQIDMYGRIVGTVYVIDDYIFFDISQSESINEKMVKNGFAWWFRDYSKKIWFENLENDAKLNKRGLWCEENNFPPWQYRKENKKGE